MPDLRQVHSFRDHAIAGVNWRPTHFVDEVPSSCVCSLCRMIPQRTVLLPCEHVLCLSCRAASSEGCGERCPLDQEPCEEAECSHCDLPTRNANTLKVYCWNEAAGCKYEGAMEDMLRHYENECTFHTVECLRCGDRVPHRELATHYVAGCSAGVSSAENISSESRALRLQDVNDAFEKVKAVLSDVDDDEQLLPAFQSQLNELTEEVRSREFRLAEIKREHGPSVDAETAQDAMTAYSTPLQEATSRRNAVDEASPSSLSGSQELLINQVPETFFNLSPAVLERMQRTCTQDYPQHYIEHFETPNSRCHLMLTRELSTTRTWTEVLGSATYIVTVDRCDQHVSVLYSNTKLCNITVLHTRDAYFAVDVHNTVSDYGCTLCVEIHFLGTLAGALCWAPNFNVTVRDLEREKVFSLHRSYSPCLCKDVGDSWVDFHGKFVRTFRDLKSAEFLRDGKLELEIQLSNKENTEARQASS